MKKIVIVGNGGREHALFWKINNDFINSSAQVIRLTDNCEMVLEFCQKESVDLVVIGPEQALHEGLVDRLREKGIKAFGPTAKAAQLESSKKFAKEFMQKHSVATAEFHSFKGRDKKAIELIEHYQGYLVLKFDGLAAGKGVYVCSSLQEAFDSLEKIFLNYGPDANYLIEERIVGPEISILGITDGKDIALFPPARDHKRLLDGNLGPNTGGMGVFCPVPNFTDEQMRECHEKIISPTLKGIEKENLDYRGFIYFGIMLTSNGPKLLEYNARMGDPETEVIMPLLDCHLTNLIEACLENRLGIFLEKNPIKFFPKYAVDVVLASEGYPQKIQTGKIITGLEKLNPETLVFISGARKENKNLLTTGGRVLNVVCTADTLKQAVQNVYSEVRKIHFEGMQYRRDIASQNKRIVILISGRGSNMEQIVHHCQDGILKGVAEVVAVVSNKPEAKGLQVATNKGVTACVVKSQGKNKNQFEEELLKCVQGFSPDYIVLAGYMKILSSSFVKNYANKIINIHPADTSLHQGLGAYEWAFALKRKNTAITVHYVDAGVDTGTVIGKMDVDLTDCHTLEEVEKRGLSCEHTFYSQMLYKVFTSKEI